MSESTKRADGTERWQRVAQSYESTWAPVTGLFVPDLLDAARSGPGTRLLDLATGSGLVAAHATERGSSVVGLDLASAMVCLASRHLPHVSFVVGDAVRLPFASGAFDGAVMNFGLHHFWDPGSALLGLAGTLRHGGRVSYTAWGPSEENPALEAIDAVYEEHFREELGTLSRDSFAFGDPGRIEVALAAVGCRPGTIEIRTVQHHWRPERAEDVFEAELEGGGAKSDLLRSAPPERLEVVREAVAAKVREYETAGGIAIPMAAIVVSALWEAADD